MFLFALQISSAANLPATTNADNVSGQSGFKPVAGIHYRDIKQTVAVSNDTIIFLWYGCNSCFQLELQYAANNPNWQRLPVSLYKSWRPQTKLFYTMRSLNLEPSSDLKLMSAIADGSVASNDLAAQKKTILSPPIAAADIDKVYSSKIINQQAAFSDTLTQQLKIKHVPAALIAGKYFLDLSMVSGLQQFVDSIHFLEKLSLQQTPPKTEEP